MSLKSKFRKGQSNDLKQKINIISYEDFLKTRTQDQKLRDATQIEEMKRAEAAGESFNPLFFHGQTSYLIVRVESFEHLNVLEKSLCGIVLFLKSKKEENAELQAVKTLVYVLDEYYDPV